MTTEHKPHSKHVKTIRDWLGAMDSTDDWQGLDALNALQKLDEQLGSVESELRQLERWAGQQNAGNAFAEQVRYWALGHLEKLNGR